MYDSPIHRPLWPCQSAGAICTVVEVCMPAPQAAGRHDSVCCDGIVTVRGLHQAADASQCRSMRSLGHSLCWPRCMLLVRRSFSSVNTRTRCHDWVVGSCNFNVMQAQKQFAYEPQLIFHFQGAPCKQPVLARARLT